jgi:hypothetical protein
LNARDIARITSLCKRVHLLAFFFHQFFSYFRVEFFFYTINISLTTQSQQRGVKKNYKMFYLLALNWQMKTFSSSSFYILQLAGCSFFAHNRHHHTQQRVSIKFFHTIVKVSRVCFQRTNKKDIQAYDFTLWRCLLVSVQIVVIVFRSKPQIIATWLLFYLLSSKKYSHLFF